MIHAYDEIYLDSSVNILGHAFDFAVNTLGINIKSFSDAFLVSKSSGIPLRQIQLFEQKQRDINKTSADTLYRLSKALCCKMEDLLELSNIN